MEVEEKNKKKVEEQKKESDSSGEEAPTIEEMRSFNKIQRPLRMLKIKNKINIIDNYG